MASLWLPKAADRAAAKAAEAEVAKKLNDDDRSAYSTYSIHLVGL